MAAESEVPLAASLASFSGPIRVGVKRVELEQISTRPESGHRPTNEAVVRLFVAQFPFAGPGAYGRSVTRGPSLLADDESFSTRLLLQVVVIMAGFFTNRPVHNLRSKVLLQLFFAMG